MKKSSFAGLALAIAVGAQLVTSGLYAQDVQPSAEGTEATGGGDTLDTLIVTGSYIPTSEAEGALPVQQYDIEQLNKFGSQTVVEGLRELPSFVGAASTENDSNGGDGSAFVNLRGFGQENVLTQINGRRAAGLSDLNLVPYGAIGKVDILKDGASATYGADAVSGVVNIKLKQNFDGTEFNILYGNTTNNDQSTVRGYFTSGFHDEKLSITAGATYYHRNAIYSADRFLSSSSDTRRFGGNNTGSGTFPGRNDFGVLIDPTQLPTSPDDYRPYDGPNDAYNFRTQTPAIPEQESSGYFVDFEYKILPNDALTFFGTAIYATREQKNGLASSPLFIFAGPNDPDPNLAGQNLELSPYNFAPDDIGLERYRSLEFSPRLSKFNIDDYHYIAGLKGKFAKDYYWEVGYMYDESTEDEEDSGDIQPSLLGQEVAAGNFNPFVGLGGPTSGTAPILNPNDPNFGGTQTYDNAAALQRSSYVANSVLLHAIEETYDVKVGGTIAPDLYQGGINFIVGAEFRHDNRTNSSDPILVSGDVGGFNAAASDFKAYQTVISEFAEVSLPLVIPDNKVPFIYAFELGAAYRFEDFDVHGPGGQPGYRTDIPKYSFRYQPFKDLTLRGSYSRSFRTPGFTDLFLPQTPGADFPQLFDPANPAFNGGPALVQPTVGDTIGGNLDLQPERTDSWTAGLVYTPSFVPGLTMTIDYYQLNSKDVIVPGASAAQFVVSQNAANGSFGDLVTRNADGTLASVSELPFNAGRKAVEGIDVVAGYELPTEHFGKYTFSLGYNHLTRFNAEIVPGAGFTNFLGQFSSAPLTPGSLPYNKGYAQLEWQKGGFDFVSTVNYIGDYQDDVTVVQRDVREYTTLDVQASYEFKAPVAVEGSQSYSKDGKTVMSTEAGYAPSALAKLLGGTRISAGVKNLFDEAPPYSAGAFNDNYDTSLYSIEGRYYYVSLNKKF